MKTLKLFLVLIPIILTSCNKDDAFLSDREGPPPPVDNTLETGRLEEQSILEESFDVEPAPKDIDLVWIIDKSGSMDNNIHLLKKSLRHIFEKFDFISEEDGINFRMALFGVAELSSMKSDPNQFTSQRLRELVADLGDEAGREKFANEFIDKFEKLSRTSDELPMRVAINSAQWASAHALDYPTQDNIGQIVQGGHKFMLDCHFPYVLKHSSCYDEDRSNPNKSYGKNHYEFFSAGDNRKDGLPEKNKKRWMVYIPVSDEDAPTVGNGFIEETQERSASAPHFGFSKVANQERGKSSPIYGQHRLESYLYGESRNTNCPDTNGDGRPDDECPNRLISDLAKAERRKNLKCEVYKRIKRIDNELGFLGREKGFIKFFPIINTESEADVSVVTASFGSYSRPNFVLQKNSPLEDHDKVGHRAEMASEITGGQAFSLNSPKVAVVGEDAMCVAECSDSTDGDCVQDCMDKKHYLGIMSTISKTLVEMVQNRFRLSHKPDPATLKVFLKRPGQSRELIDSRHYEIKLLSSAQGTSYQKYDCSACAGVSGYPECSSSSGAVVPEGTAFHVVIKSGVLDEDSKLFVRYQRAN